jgi:soluble lytic murein transglycosylase
MRKYGKKYFSVLSCLALISLIYANFPGSEVKCDEGKSEKAAIHKVFQHLKDKRVKLGDDDLQVVAGTIWRQSRSYNVDYHLVLALIEVESGYRHDVTSPDGSRGFMQLKPDTAREIAHEAEISYKGSSELFDPKKNIEIGVCFLSKLLGEFKSIRRALYAYNVGLYRAKRMIIQLPINRDPNTRFTQRVMQAFQRNISILPAS